MSIIDEIKKQVPYNEVVNQFNLDTSTPPDVTIDRLAPNNYLTIIWKDKITGNIYNTYEDLAINNSSLVQYTTSLNNAINNALNNTNTGALIGNNKYINVESIAKYLSQNMIPSGVSRDVVNAIIGLLTGSKTSLSNSAVNLMVNVFGDIAKKVAKSIGFSDPHEAFASIVSENSLAFLNVLGKKTKDKLIDFASNKLNLPINKVKSKISLSSNTQYVGLILGLTTSDTESYEITIPRRKVENGSNYTTHLLPQPFKKEFNVKLTNKVLTSIYDYEQEIDNIEKIKNKLIEISQSHTTFDIYIRLSNGHMYKKSNVVFSSISFTKDESSGNGYECSFTIEPIEEFYTKTFISDRKYFPKISTSGSSASGAGGAGGATGSGRSGSSKGTGSGGKKNNIGDKNKDGKSQILRSNLGNNTIKDMNVNSLEQAIGAVETVNSNSGTGAPFDTLEFIGNKPDMPTYQMISTKDMVYTEDGSYVPRALAQVKKGYYSGPDKYVLADGVKKMRSGELYVEKGAKLTGFDDTQGAATKGGKIPYTYVSDGGYGVKVHQTSGSIRIPTHKK